MLCHQEYIKIVYTMGIQCIKGNSGQASLKPKQHDQNHYNQHRYPPRQSQQDFDHLMLRGQPRDSRVRIKRSPLKEIPNSPNPHMESSIIPKNKEDSSEKSSKRLTKTQEVNKKSNVNHPSVAIYQAKNIKDQPDEESIKKSKFSKNSSDASCMNFERPNPEVEARPQQKSVAQNSEIKQKNNGVISSGEEEEIKDEENPKQSRKQNNLLESQRPPKMTPFLDNLGQPSDQESSEELTDKLSRSQLTDLDIKPKKNTIFNTVQLNHEADPSSQVIAKSQNVQTDPKAQRLSVSRQSKGIEEADASTIFVRVLEPDSYINLQNKNSKKAKSDRDSIYAHNFNAFPRQKMEMKNKEDRKLVQSRKIQEVDFDLFCQERQRNSNSSSQGLENNEISKLQTKSEKYDKRSRRTAPISQF